MHECDMLQNIEVRKIAPIYGGQKLIQERFCSKTKETDVAYTLLTYYKKRFGLKRSSHQKKSLTVKDFQK